MKSVSEPACPSRRDVFRIAALSAVGIGSSASEIASAAPTISGPLRSAGVLTFGPDNVLFVGDIAGAAIHAFALREKDLTPQTDVELGNFHNFEGRDLVQGVGQKLPSLRA